MIKKSIFGLIFFILTGLLVLGVSPVTASPQIPQVFDSTPTPDQDGRIIYQVKEGDNCTSVALRFLDGDVNQLVALNGLDPQECLITVNQELLLGIFEEPTITPGPSPTPTISPTPFTGTGDICVLLFDDVNGNGMAEEGEVPIADGAINISDQKGRVSQLKNSTFEFDDEGDPLPVCFVDLPEGEYTISVGPPEGYNATTIMNYQLPLIPGDQSTVDFGAQISSSAVITPEAFVEETRRSPLLGIVGGIMVIAGIVLGAYFLVFNRRKE
ncbi:MAG: LysM peptidoglycan-binding domain-containing protein [Anaerolineaceae bacterium]|nr:LysM peptidoglycan-binding domain-containing protein [Anaerolineaceae bacterium]